MLCTQEQKSSLLAKAARSEFLLPIQWQLKHAYGQAFGSIPLVSTLLNLCITSIARWLTFSSFKTMRQINRRLRIANSPNCLVHIHIWNASSGKIVIFQNCQPHLSEWRTLSIPFDTNVSTAAYRVLTTGHHVWQMGGHLTNPAPKDCDESEMRIFKYQILSSLSLLVTSLHHQQKYLPVCSLKDKSGKRYVLHACNTKASSSEPQITSDYRAGFTWYRLASSLCPYRSTTWGNQRGQGQPTHTSKIYPSNTWKMCDAVYHLISLRSLSQTRRSQSDYDGDLPELSWLQSFPIPMRVAI